jgi:putative membrane protein
METLITILISIVALEHFYFMYLEMFLWTTPKGIKTFGLKSKEFAQDTKVLAANQGLYNGFLACGLVFSLVTEMLSVSVFFLSCVAIAGIYGAYSTKKTKLFYLQSVPALVTLILIMINN